MKKSFAVLLAAVLAGCSNTDTPISTAGGPLSLTQMGRFTTGIFDGGAAEVPAYDAVSKRLFVVNAATVPPRVDVLDLSNPVAPTKVSQITFNAGEAPNSVAVRNGVLAVALQAAIKTDPGRAVFYMTNANFGTATDATLDTPAGSATVGSLPDMLMFASNTRVLVANEGEPNNDYTVDPEGSVSIVNIGTLAAPVVTTANFNAFDARKNELIAAGVRIFGAFGAAGAVAGGSSVSQDLEPEYITVSADGNTAWVSLQEANALAKIDIATATVTAIFPLGYKNHGIASNDFDAGDRDSTTTANAAAIKFQSAPVFGMYQPDGIAAYTLGSETFIVTANEGDAREYTGCTMRGCQEVVRAGATNAAPTLINNYTLDPVAFPDAATLKSNLRLGRLNVTNVTGNPDGDGDFDQIFAFGARSFSIFRGSNGALVYDSGNDFESITSSRFPLAFNASNSNNDLDNRSDDKGPEPEGVVLGKIGSKTYAFICLERVGGVMVYDITNPLFPTFEHYINNRLFTTGLNLTTNVTANNASDGDLGPEAMVFIPADQSPNGANLLVVANEISGTTTIYRVNGGG